MSATANPATPPTGSPPPANTASVERAEGPIPIDPALEEAPETQSEAETGSIFSSSTASLSESIYDYRRIHGRTYTQKVDYWGPNDERQNEGLEINHWIMTIFLGDRLFLSPIGENPQRVLDLGTGTGIWAIDFADEFPSTEVFGVDVSPIQPKWVPTNCKFQIDDIEQPWTWPDNHFDFIHIRNLEGCISNWTDLYKQAFESMAPGGYIEVKEHDIELRSQTQELDDGHAFKSFSRNLLEACGRLGKVGLQCRNHGIAKSLKAAGFVDIVERKWPIPVGAWANDLVLKQVGSGALEFLDKSVEGFGIFLLKEVMGWEMAEILVLSSEFRKALKKFRSQPVFDLHIVYARKPETPMKTA
ncbi:Secondary metabolism regulator laeA [Colletotrichum tropicale]|nr:Secondary metabolism regulator laeA [Colletotrichum tropicale]